MKKTLFLLLLLQVAGTVAATTHTVNNNNPSPGQHTSINAAIGAAAAGDTILVTGSPISYFNFSVTKNNLTFIGAGHKPQKAPGYSTFIDDIILASNLSGVKIQGFNLNGIPGAANADNVTIEYCLIRSQMTCSTNCNNWTIRNCIFSTPQANFNSVSAPGRSDILITNNIFSQGSKIAGLSNSNTGVIISNNIFLKGSGSDGGAFSDVANATIINNIFYQMSPTGVSASIFNNNLTFGATNNELPPTACTNCGGMDNIINQNPLFTTYTSGQNFSYAHDYILQAGSPGKNAGGDGTDLGVYGLNNIFSETGEPPIPVVRTLTIANPNTAKGALLNVTVTASNPDSDQ